MEKKITITVTPDGVGYVFNGVETMHEVLGLLEQVKINVSYKMQKQWHTGKNAHISALADTTDQHPNNEAGH